MAKRKGFKSAIDKVSTSLQQTNDEAPKEEKKPTTKKTTAATSKVKAKKPKFTLEDAKEVEQKLEKKRQPVTLMMRPDIKKTLDNIAENKNTKLSSILEAILLDYFDLPE